MKYKMILLFALLGLLIAAFALPACGDDDDDDCESASCPQDDDDDDSQCDDDDAADDDDSDDLLGISPEAQACIDQVSSDSMTCREECPESGSTDNDCDHYYCTTGCFEAMYDGSLDCAGQYPELSAAVPYWTCMRDCQTDMIDCMEPLDECDFDLFLTCLETAQQCEVSCLPS